MKKLKLSRKDQAKVMAEINKKSDTFTFRFLLIYSIFGLFISFYYDTWLIGGTAAALAIGTWFAIKALLPNHDLHRYVASGFLGVFVGTFIYQMHGLFEMHFFAFIGSAILIVYQNWRFQIPLIAVVVVHHAVFAFLQYSGVPDVYFTQLEYMDLHTFIYHACLAAAVVIVCGYWAHHFKSLTIENAEKSVLLEEKVQVAEKLNKNLAKAGNVVQQRNKELEETKRKLLELTEKQANMYEQLRKGEVIKNKP